ncbi:hypothetical protein ACQWU4_00230 [Chryseobacterium sp. MIQD13]
MKDEDIIQLVDFITHKNDEINIGVCMTLKELLKNPSKKHKLI